MFTSEQGAVCGCFVIRVAVLRSGCVLVMEGCIDTTVHDIQ